MLVEALQFHHAPLSASLLAVYGVRLAATDLSLLELADLTANLPDGCAFWQSVGGPRAWSQETQMLAVIEYDLRILQWQNNQGKGQKPKPPQPPAYAGEERVADARMRAKSERWKSRHV